MITLKCPDDYCVYSKNGFCYAKGGVVELFFTASGLMVCNSFSCEIEPDNIDDYCE